MKRKNERPSSSRRVLDRRRILELIVVEWREDEQCFRFDTLDRVLNRNRIAYLSHFLPLYIPVALATNYDRAREITESLRLERRFREPIRVIH